MLVPLLLCGVSAQASVTKPVQTQPAQPLPASYGSFYPTDQARVAPRLNIAPTDRNRAQIPEHFSSNLFGYLYFFQGEALQQGMYRVDPTQGATFLWQDEFTGWSMALTGGWLRNGRLYGLSRMSFMGGILFYQMVELNPDSGEIYDFTSLRRDGSDWTNMYFTSAYREFDDRVYGYGFNPDGQGYGFNSAPATDIDASEMITEVPEGLVCTSLCYNVQDDLFYGVTRGGEFVKVNIEGEQETIFTLNLPGLTGTVTGIVYDPTSCTYVWNAYFEDGTSAMYSIDPVAKKCEKLMDCGNGEEYIFMYTSDANALPGAPASPVYVGSEFTGSSTSGTVDFMLPGKTQGGDPLAGTLDWRLLVDGNESATGQGTAGAALTVNVENLAPGFHTFAFDVANATGRSIPATFQRWIGSDYPETPANIVLTEEKVTWDAVTAGVHDGYVDPQAVTYTVRLNDRVIGTTQDTEYDIALPQGEPFNSYTVTVVATFDGLHSEAGASNFITYGEPLKIDPSIHFRPEEKEFELFKVIDIDGKTDSEGNPRMWHFSETMGFPSFASGADGDDLLIFPPMAFDNTDKAYKFRMEAGLIHDRDNTGTIEVLLGKEPTLEAMTQVVIPQTRLYYMLGKIMEEYFAVQEAGTYYIGIRTRCHDVAMHISDMDIAITERAADVPVAVNDLAAVAGENGALTSTVTFTMPSKTANGSDISASSTLTATVVAREYVQDHPDQGEACPAVTVTGAPGSKQTVEIPTHQGLNTIAVKCAIDGREGSDAWLMLYTGLVKPYIVQNLKQEISEDNMSVRLTWTPPVEAGDDSNGPIGDSFYYSLWYYGNGWTFLDGIGQDVCEVVVPVEDNAPLTYYMLGVMAMNDAGQSEYIASVTSILGTPYTLPMNETFPDGYETYEPVFIQRPSEEYEGTSWMADDPATVHALFANESGVAFIGYISDPYKDSAKSRLSIPKFSTKGKRDVKFTLNYWGGVYAAQFSLLGAGFDTDAPITIGDFARGAAGWTSATLSVPEALNGRDWVELYLDSNFANNQEFALFCGYSISGVSGIEGVEDGEGRIYSTPGMVHVAGFTGEALTITDLSGVVLVREAELADIAGFALRPGIYIVRAGQKTVKLTVR